MQVYSALAKDALEVGDMRSHRRKVYFVQCYQLGAVSQGRLEMIQLIIDGLIIVPWAERLVCSELKKMNEQAGTLDVTQKTPAEACSFVGPGDETGNVSHHKAAEVLEEDNA